MPPTPDLPGALAGLQPDLLRLAHHLTGSRDQAQDLSQDVLLKLWARLKEGEAVGNLRAYAMTTLRNTYRQSLRQKIPGAELEDDMLSAPPDVFAALALDALDGAIDRLPPDQARLIRLVAAGETSPADLARLTGVPSGTIMSRLARARARLRADMGLARKAPVSDLI